MSDTCVPTNVITIILNIQSFQNWFILENLIKSQQITCHLDFKNFTPTQLSAHDKYRVAKKIGYPLICDKTAILMEKSIPNSNTARSQIMLLQYKVEEIHSHFTKSTPCSLCRMEKQTHNRLQAYRVTVIKPAQFHNKIRMVGKFDPNSKIKSFINIYLRLFGINFTMWVIIFWKLYTIAIQGVQTLKS